MANKKTEIVKAGGAKLAKPMEQWEMDLANEAKAEVAKETTGMARISHKGGRLTIDGKQVDGNKLRVAIVDYIFTKTFFAEKYQEGKSDSPTCYAYGRQEDGTVPHPSSKEKQAETCDACPHNAYGTADFGRGKACPGGRRLAVIVPTGDEDSLAGAELRSITVPAGSLKNWGRFMNTVPEVTPTGNVRALLTEISTEPKGAVYALTFKPVERLAGEQVQAIMALRERAYQQLTQPWPTISDEEQEKKPAKASRAKKVS